MKTYKFTQAQLDAFAKLMYVSGCLSITEHVKQNGQAHDDGEITVTPKLLKEMDDLAEPDAYVMNDGIVNTLCDEQFEGVERSGDLFASMKRVVNLLVNAADKNNTTLSKPMQEAIFAARHAQKEFND